MGLRGHYIHDVSIYDLNSYLLCKVPANTVSADIDLTIMTNDKENLTQYRDQLKIKIKDI